MKGVLAAMVISVAIPASAMADPVAEFTQDLGRVVGAFTAAHLYVEHCDRRDPATAPARRDILAGWSYENEAESYDRLMAGVIARAPEVSAQLAPQRARLDGLIADDIADDPGQCANLLEILEKDEQFSVRSTVRRLLNRARALGIEVPAPDEIVPAAKRVDDTQILRLAALSARLEEKMDEIGSRAGARNQRNLANARTHHAESWLAADGVQVLYGRVTRDTEMREWRGELQSIFRVECDTFRDDAHRDRMAASIGQELVVVGTPGSVIHEDAGGRLRLKQCALFTPEETGRPFAEAEDAAGLMPRPLEESEAYGGPDRGIAMRDVDRLLYQSSFESRLDGFGNGYVDRDEAVYVLLRDGSAYRHAWSFPFTDLDIQASHRREPERWFDWVERGDAVALTGRGSDEADDVRLLENAETLRPMPPVPVNARYDYLQVGLGGSRQDRSFEFFDDGTVRYRASSFVAGNVALGHLTVTGPQEPVVTGRYRFERYALIIDRGDASERYFFAVPESADEAVPATVLIRGQAYWLAKE